MKEYKDRKLLYVHDGRVFIDKNGNVYGSPNDIIIALRKRYEYMAPNIRFVQRAFPLDERDKSNLIKFNDIGITVIPVPNVSSLSGMIHNSKRAESIMEEAIASSDFLILRNSKNTALAQLIAERLKKPYIFEVVSCNWDALWNYSLKGKLYAPYAYFRMKYNVAKAKYTIYVTEQFLQKRYPNKHATVGISDVMINPISKEGLSLKIDKYRNNSDTIILTTCAAVDVKYKGQEFIIEAISHLKEKYNIYYHLAGGGTRDYLQNIARKFDVEDRVIFHGSLSKDEVNELLDNTTIYCQPSKQEGLPRAVVEAMSRGCVCIGSKTGGIPELLDSNMIARKGNVSDFTKLIDTILQNPAIASAQAVRNYEMAFNYRPEILDNRRCLFYDKFIREN